MPLLLADNGDANLSVLVKIVHATCEAPTPSVLLVPPPTDVCQRTRLYQSVLRVNFEGPSRFPRLILVTILHDYQGYSS